tara:strand:- start:154 stop:921 length:768 start_codon:yes stop_codon:yes gene_type:complete
MRRKEDPLDNIFAIIQGHTGPPLALLLVTAATVGSALTTLALRRWGPEASSSHRAKGDTDELDDLDETSIQDSAIRPAMNSTMKRADDAAWDTYFAMDASTPSGQVDWARHDHTESSFEHDDIDEETLWRGASEAIETLAGDGLRSSGFSGAKNVSVGDAMDESPPLSEGAKRRMDGRRRRSLDGIDQASLSPRVMTIAEDATIGPTEHGDETARMVTPVTQKATQKRLDAVFAAQEESPRRTVLGNVTNARPRR